MILACAQPARAIPGNMSKIQSGSNGILDLLDNPTADGKPPSFSR